jgi:methionyl-tRNA formyltransferase
MRIFLFLGSRRGYAVLKKLIEEKADIAGILCLIEDPHEAPYHQKITALANTCHLPIKYSNEIKPTNYAKLLEEIKPDIVFVIGWRYLITSEAYLLPAKGTLVIHDSLLPKYRGFAPMNWAIINGETQTGVTLFYMDAGVDSGPIVDQLKCQIDFSDTAQTLDEKIIALYGQIIVKNLPALANGSAPSYSQNENDATYTCKRTPADGKIDWRRPAIEIYHLIRALTKPFPGAFTFLNGKKIYVWQAALPENKKNYVGIVPGRVLVKNQEFIEVLAADGPLRLLKLGMENDEELAILQLPCGVKDTFGE